MPAQWYSVVIDSPPEGVHGSSDLEVTSGGLETVSRYDPDRSGFAAIWANDALSAVRLTLGGTVTVQDYAYTLSPSALSDDSAEHDPFLLVATPDGYEIRLEDLAGAPGLSDWDYNDTTWAISLREYGGGATPPKPTPTTAKPKEGPTLVKNIETARINKYVDLHPNNTKVVASISGGHMDGSMPATDTIEVGVGTAKRIATITYTPKPVDPNVDTTKVAHEVNVTATIADPGPPPGATPGDIANSPVVTTVVPNPTVPKAMTKTFFPVDPVNWDKTQIKGAIITGAIQAQRIGAQPEWVPDMGNANKGHFVIVVNGVKIRGDWEFVDPSLIITHAYPVP